ncbi:hypothetical protein R1flu_022771 [Riccia fluitans]|uniref:Uncharacterized protein n=1 Tax=Riccia fluitans TaxID=41844 RepID=A0ABD1XQ46_9MARC
MPRNPGAGRPDPCPAEYRIKYVPGMRDFSQEMAVVDRIGEYRRLDSRGRFKYFSETWMKAFRQERILMLQAV